MSRAWFLLDADKAKGAWLPEPPTELETFVLALRLPEPPIETEDFVLAPGPTFDPETITVLSAAYHKAINGQPASIHEIIAKWIIKLASDGEREPDSLCHAVHACVPTASLTALASRSICSR